MNLKCDECQEKISRSRSYIPKGTNKIINLCLGCWDKQFKKEEETLFGVIGNKTGGKWG